MSLAQKIIKLNSQIDILDKAEKEMVDSLHDAQNNLYSDKEKKIREIEDKYSKQAEKLEVRVKEAKQASQRKVDVIDQEKKAIISKIGIIMIHNNLKVAKKGKTILDQDNFFDLSDLNYFYIKTFIFTNRNKVNNTDMEIRVFPKHSYISSIIEDEFAKGMGTNIFDKTFKSKEDAEKYHQKHFSKIVEKVMIADIQLNELYDEAVSEGIDPQKEFDFRLIDYNISGMRLKKRNKGSITFTGNYPNHFNNDYKDSFEGEIVITYKGENVFEVNNSTDAAKGFARNILERSSGDLWFDNPKIVVKK